MRHPLLDVCVGAALLDGFPLTAPSHLTLPIAHPGRGGATITSPPVPPPPPPDLAYDQSLSNPNLILDIIVTISANLSSGVVIGGDTPSLPSLSPPPPHLPPTSPNPT
jgi:hypothetical protein